MLQNLTNPPPPHNSWGFKSLGTEKLLSGIYLSSQHITMEMQQILMHAWPWGCLGSKTFSDRIPYYVWVSVCDQVSTGQELLPVQFPRRLLSLSKENQVS